VRIIRFQKADGSEAWGEEHPDGTATVLRGDPYTRLMPTQENVEMSRLLAPIAPVSILCIGLNYRQHAAETKASLPQFPVLFMKGVNAVQHPGEPIVLPRWLASTKVDYECELAVVIGRTCKNVRREEALAHVLGYMCANDVSARDWQKEGGGSQWCRGKTFDTFAPLGPALVTRDEIPDPQTLRIRTRENGEVLQDSSTEDMVLDVPTLIEFLSASTTLPAGTVILTGTPHGVGMARQPPRFLEAGDVVAVEIEKIGTLSNPVIEEACARHGASFRL
jgi:2-keto-4-pentenoate hydratase/2-oxohepta-3-ene-1,7-dioic acid hydratase in catechol pathway